jgi:hypothetical protein
MSEIDKLNAIQGILTTATVDMQNFLKGNNAAGTRVRKGMQQIKVLAQDVRVNVSEIKNNRKK